METSSILIISERPASEDFFHDLLTRDGYQVATCPPGVYAPTALLEVRPCAVVIVSPSASDLKGVAAARAVREVNRDVPVIFLTAASSEELAIAALKAGASDYFKMPVSPDDLLGSVRRHAPPPPKDPGANQPDLFPAFSPSQEFIGESSGILAVKKSLPRIVGTDSNILVTGETGTGKEIVAQLVHEMSPRRDKPFISVNCAAIPDTLLESELFGYEKGAFTGAQSSREGSLKLAEGGTLLLDEIGDMSPLGQAKILRAIELKEVRRLGGRKSSPIDVRIIAATNKDLESLVAEERFRKDLFFRLNVLRLHLPPLRERKEDLSLVCDHFVGELNRKFGTEVSGFSEEALDHLIRYSWPGNVRELKNMMEATFINHPWRRITTADLPEQFRQKILDTDAADPVLGERDRLLSALTASRWNKSQAARKLHWSRMTLYRKLHKYRIMESGTK